MEIDISEDSTSASLERLQEKNTAPTEKIKLKVSSKNLLKIIYEK